MLIDDKHKTRDRQIAAARASPPASQRASGRTFSGFSRRLAALSGRGATFGIAVLMVVVWAVSGPYFDFSDTWQLVINTGTTVITFLMVFLIQNTQNRDTQALQIKLDELIRAVKGGHNALMDLEDMSEEELEAQRLRYAELARIAREKLSRGESDEGCPQVPEISKAAD